MFAFGSNFRPELKPWDSGLNLSFDNLNIVGPARETAFLLPPSKLGHPAESMPKLLRRRTGPYDESSAMERKVYLQDGY